MLGDTEQSSNDSIDNLMLVTPSELLRAAHPALQSSLPSLRHRHLCRVCTAPRRRTHQREQSKPRSQIKSTLFQSWPSSYHNTNNITTILHSIIPAGACCHVRLHLRQGHGAVARGVRAVALAHRKNVTLCTGTSCSVR